MHPSRYTLFVPHGAPTFALHPGAIGRAMSEVARRFEAPRAIVIVSPHWTTSAPTIGAAAELETIHDFYGFDPALYTLRYPARGDATAAGEVALALRTAGIDCSVDGTRGLDHGAWIPLREMFPAAQVPIVPLSVQAHLGPRHALQIGRALAPLVQRGFLIIGSGNVTHNLHDWSAVSLRGAPTPDYVERFPDWLAERLHANDLRALLDYRVASTDGARAHPTEEHLLPLFTALGAAPAGAQAHRYVRATNDHVISMDGYFFE